MSDYSEQGAVPVEDAAVDDPPTESEVWEKHRQMVEEEGGEHDHGHHEPLDEPSD